MTVAPRARWYVRIFQFSPLVAGALLAFVLVAVPSGLRAQIDMKREYPNTTATRGTDGLVRELEPTEIAEQYLKDAAGVPGSGPLPQAWRGVQVFIAVNQGSLLGMSGLLLAMAIVASPASFVLERRRISQALVLEEMERVQQDAHDKVYNRLSALSKRVEIASETISSEVAHSLDGVAEDIRDTVTDLQDILGDARQRTASLAGKDPLRSQLESVAREQAARLGVTVNLTLADDLPTLNAQTGWDLQCVFEEAISNAIEHGAATVVAGTVTIEDPMLVLRITDNGTGMPESDVDALPEEHMGLRGMRNRAERHGGTFSVSGGAGGTMVEVRVPLGGHSPV